MTNDEYMVENCKFWGRNQKGKCFDLHGGKLGESCSKIAFPGCGLTIILKGRQVSRKTDNQTTTNQPVNSMGPIPTRSEVQKVRKSL